MKKVWDRLGIAISSVCVVHCIAVAFLPILFPVLSLYYAHLNWVHGVVGIAILFTTPLAFLPGYRKHGLSWIIATALSGVFLVGLGWMMEDQVSEQLSHGVAIVGSMFLVFAHFKNIQHSHSHQHQCC